MIKKNQKKNNKNNNNKNTKLDYIQYSKKITKWGIILVTAVLCICLASISFCGLPSEAITAITTLYTAYVTIMGVTIGAYQGNSSVEKWSKARYQYTEALNWNQNDESEDHEDDENTNG